MTEKQLLTWLLAMPACADVSRAMQELSGAKYSTNEQNKEKGKSRQRRDMKDTHTLLLTMSERNPFAESTSLRNIMTGVDATGDDEGRKWMVRFENRIKAMNFTDQERKLALLLDYAGEDVHDDFLTLTVPPAAGGNDPPGNDIYHRSIVALDTHYAPQVQREYEVFSFRTAKQEEDESLDQFVTRLRKLGATCDLANLSSEIKSQVIQKCRSSRLRTKGMSDLTMSLEDLIKAWNAIDRAVAYTMIMEGDTAMSVNQLFTRKFTKQNHQRANRHDDFRRQQPSHSKNQPTETCVHCGRSST